MTRSVFRAAWFSTSLILALALSSIACARPTPPAPAAGPPLPRVVFPTGAAVTVELAISPESRYTGLMFRESLADGHGMLFFPEAPSRQSFWMKNCRFPIDIVFLDAARTVVTVAASVPPCRVDPCPTYVPTVPALFVLEVNAGVAAAQQLAPGARVEFENLPMELLPAAARAALAPPASSSSSPR